MDNINDPKNFGGVHCQFLNIRDNIEKAAVQLWEVKCIFLFLFWEEKINNNNNNKINQRSLLPKVLNKRKSTPLHGLYYLIFFDVLLIVRYILLKYDILSPQNIIFYHICPRDNFYFYFFLKKNNNNNPKTR
jgi:hypothetical protein